MLFPTKLITLAIAFSTLSLAWVSPQHPPRLLKYTLSPYLTNRKQPTPRLISSSTIRSPFQENLVGSLDGMEGIGTMLPLMAPENISSDGENLPSLPGIGHEERITRMPGVTTGSVLAVVRGWFGYHGDGSGVLACGMFSYIIL